MKVTFMIDDGTESGSASVGVVDTQHPFDALTEADLRSRQSAKWRVFPSNVLPAWVAEMDFPIADPIRRVLHAAIDADDVGYADPRGLGEAFAPFAESEWSWQVAPTDVVVVADVVTALQELLAVTTGEGDGVVIEPPVYHPFGETIRRLRRRVVEAPLVRADDGSYRFDLVAIERAYASGARVHLLCSPHNPTGVVLDRELLVAIADLADRYGVLVLADEIHAPLTLPGARHLPFTSVSEAARRRGIVVTSASKTWNLAGLKAAVIVATSDETRAVLRRLPVELPYHAGHLGVLASRAAFVQGADWRSDVLRILDRNRHLLAELLAEHLPGARYVPPAASYLAWIDFRALDLGPDPAKVFLAHGAVALSSGPIFGAGGDGFARLNLATSRPLLVEAVTRIAGGVAAYRTSLR